MQHRAYELSRLLGLLGEEFFYVSLVKIMRHAFEADDAARVNEERM